jgi:hypothetical protein
MEALCSAILLSLLVCLAIGLCGLNSEQYLGILVWSRGGRNPVWPHWAPSMIVPMLSEISYAKEHKLIAGGIQQTGMAT